MQYYGTLGPACRDERILENMFRAGMTGVRINLSHGDLDENLSWLEILKTAAVKAGRETAPQILIDLQGPELRLGRGWKERELKLGEIVQLGKAGTAVDAAAAAGRMPVPEALLTSVESGDRILADDGKIELTVEGVSGSLCARVLRPGTLKPGKSLAVVGKELPMPTLTQSDHKNIRLAAACGVTGVMLPFVRSKEDLLTLRSELSEAGAANIEIFAKIENMQGVRKIDELLPWCDQIVIARGDLGNAMPLWELPGVQKQLAAKCRKNKKPFMVVTQMLDSMHERAVPTRAEVLDIYNAVLDGASSVMLTGETAAGKYPAEAMEYLVRTGEEALKDRS